MVVLYIVFHSLQVLFGYLLQQFAYGEWSLYKTHTLNPTTLNACFQGLCHISMATVLFQQRLFHFSPSILNKYKQLTMISYRQSGLPSGLLIYQ